MITSLSAVSTLTVLLNFHKADFTSEAPSDEVEINFFSDWKDIPSIIIDQLTADADERGVCQNLQVAIDKLGANHLAHILGLNLVRNEKPEWIAGYLAWMKMSALAEDDDNGAALVDDAFYLLLECCREFNGAEAVDWLKNCYDYLSAAAMLGFDLYASFVAEDVNLCREVAARVSDIVDTIEDYPILVETFHKLLCRDRCAI